MANNLPAEKKATVIALLCEGSSIRSIERITGIHRGSIGRPELPEFMRLNDRGTLLKAASATSSCHRTLMGFQQASKDANCTGFAGTRG